jgi:hypothetical protein
MEHLNTTVARTVASQLEDEDSGRDLESGGGGALFSIEHSPPAKKQGVVGKCGRKKQRDVGNDGDSQKDHMKSEKLHSARSVALTTLVTTVRSALCDRCAFFRRLKRRIKS